MWTASKPLASSRAPGKPGVVEVVELRLGRMDEERGEGGWGLGVGRPQLEEVLGVVVS